MKNDPYRTPLVEIPVRAPDQLAQAICRFRKKTALTQAALAESAGIRQATVSKVEQGAGTTEVQTIFALCAALGLELVLRPRNRERVFRAEEVF